jgi:S-adenosylmethionine decarboxylase
MAPKSSLAEKEFVPEIEFAAELTAPPANAAASSTAANTASAPRPLSEPVREPGSDVPAGEAKDYFVERDGVVFAGSHVLADLWGARNLDNIDLIEHALREAVDVCGATLLHIHLHRFTEGGGVSGVAVLAESHITVHTWPERNFAAFDIFMCGKCEPMNALPVLRRFFQPTDLRVDQHRRGVVG